MGARASLIFRTVDRIYAVSVIFACLLYAAEAHLVYGGDIGPHVKGVRNPWLDLPPEAPYVLPIDQASLIGRQDLQLEALPIPYLGDPSRAKLVILLLNPGTADDAEVRSAYTANQNRLGLTFESKYPFWPLDPEVAGTRAQTWWAPRLRAISAEVGIEVLRRHLMCIQFFPYHSRTFAAGNIRLPSQSFTVHLVRDAIQRECGIVIARGRDIWSRLVPEIAAYEHLYELANPRAVYLTPRNIRSNGFHALVRHLRIA